MSRRHATAGWKSARAGLLAAATIAVTSDARAEPTVDVTYRAPSAGCPSASAFLDKVRGRLDGRTPRARFAVSLDVAGPHVTTGSLEARAEGRPTQIRTIAGASCVDVADALALTLALSATDDASPTSVAAVANETQAASRADTAWTLSAGVGAVNLLPPRPLTAASLGIEGERASARPGVHLRWDLRARAFHARNDVLSDPADAQVALTGAAVEACPLAGDFAHGSLRACGSFEAGVLSAVGRGAITPRTTRSLWAAPGAALRFLVLPVRRLVWDASVAALVPLTRDAFWFERPLQSVAAVPQVVWAATTSVGWRFP
jgi:hypothetical protein